MAPSLLPDLSDRPLRLPVERVMAALPAALFLAWTRELDRWFAAPGSVLMEAGVNRVFYFETDFEGRRHPHYGRFLKLQTDARVEMTWLTAATLGTETVVTVEMRPEDAGAHLRLTHAGFPNEESRDRHEKAWPGVLQHLDRCLTEALPSDSRR